MEFYRNIAFFRVNSGDFDMLSQHCAARVTERDQDENPSAQITKPQPEVIEIEDSQEDKIDTTPGIGFDDIEQFPRGQLQAEGVNAYGISRSQFNDSIPPCSVSCCPHDDDV